MPLIRFNIHSESMVLAWFSCMRGIHYIFLGFFQKWKPNLWKSCDHLPVLTLILYPTPAGSVFKDTNVYFRTTKTNLLSHLYGVVFILASSIIFHKADMSFLGIKAAPMFTIAKCFCFQSCFHPVMSQMYFCCHFPQLWNIQCHLKQFSLTLHCVRCCS